MPATKLKQLLDNEKVKYLSIPHSLGYTAQGIAALTHISGKEIAKTVIIKLDDRMAMAVLPASRTVDVNLLKKATRARELRLATEAEFKARFPDCETGAMPPFGNLYDMPVYVDESLTADKEIAFNAGSHTELIRLAYDDFARMVKPTVVRFAAGRATAA